MKSSRRPFALLIAALFVAAAAPLQAFTTVVLDAGHGGHDRGGVPGQRYAEKIYTLDIAQRVRNRLRAAGLRVVMTRSDDTFISLGTRCSIANKQRDAIFVSVHLNSAPREGANGIETYYYRGRSAGALAAALHPRILRAAGTEDRHIRTRGYYVLRNTRIPAVLCELGFLTNGTEGGRIARSADHRQRLADAIASGILSRR